MAYPRSIERILETIERVPILGDIITYPMRNPIKSFFGITLGLAGARHLGLINQLPTGVQNVLSTPATWSQNMYNTGIERIGTNIGGYPGWVSAPTQLFVNATRNLLGPATPPTP